MKQPKFTEEELEKMKTDYESFWKVGLIMRKVKGNPEDPFIRELMRQDKLTEQILDKLTVAVITSI